MDHIVHFYQLHGLDWSDIVSALSANPATAASLAKSISPSAKTFDFAAVKTRLQSFVSSGQLGPFANAYWGHKQYRLPPEANLVIAAHYIEALQQQTRTAKMMAMFGGKNPHPQSAVVGGVTCATSLSTTLTASFRTILTETKKFIDTIYLPDLKLVAKYYKTDWAAIGGTANFLAFGEFPSAPAQTSTKLFPRRRHHGAEPQFRGRLQSDQRPGTRPAQLV